MSSAPGPSVKVHNNRTTFILGSGDAPDMYSTTARDAFARAMPPMAARDEGGALAASKQRESSIVLGTDKFEYISTFKADEKSWSAEEAVEGEPCYSGVIASLLCLHVSCYDGSDIA